MLLVENLPYPDPDVVVANKDLEKALQLLIGDGVRRDVSLAIQLMQEQATENIVEAKYWLGATYANRNRCIHGYEQLEDSYKAFLLFEEAYQDRYKYSYVELARYYMNGEYVKQDQDKAFELLSTGALRGDNRAYFYLAEICLDQERFTDAYFYSLLGVEKKYSKRRDHCSFTRVD